MASDVTLVLTLLTAVVLDFAVASDAGNTVRMTKSAVFIDDNLYFELVEPEEISYTYKIRPAKGFGGSLRFPIRNVPLVMADPIHGCSPLINLEFIKSSIALVERGGCSFVTKSLHAEEAGALAVVIMDNDKTNDDKMVDMIGDDTDREVHLPAYFLLGRDGYMIRKVLDEMNLFGAIINIPINATGVHPSLLNQPPWSLW